MDDDTKCTITAMVCITILVLSLIAAIAIDSVNSWNQLTENGYDEVALEGTANTVWQKRLPTETKEKSK